MNWGEIVFWFVIGPPMLAFCLMVGTLILVALVHVWWLGVVGIGCFLPGKLGKKARGTMDEMLPSGW
jgi:hypothetical protein